MLVQKDGTDFFSIKFKQIGVRHDEAVKQTESTEDGHERNEKALFELMDLLIHDCDDNLHSVQKNHRA